ncbi:MAG: glycosyltransferase family 2 protein [Planctomycetota bacterium]
MVTLISGFYLVHLAIRLTLARRYVRAQKGLTIGRSLSDHLAKKITIAQPILSGDPLLEPTLRRIADDLNPKIQFVWLVDDCDVEGQDICEKLAGSRPQIAIQICPRCPANFNPKAFKLQIALQMSTRPYFVVVDDDTNISEDSVISAIESLDQFDLYTGLPVYRKGKNWASNLLTHFVNNNAILTYLAPLNFFKPITINGMFYVVERQKFVDLGGYQSIIQKLCDDLAVCEMTTKAGWRIKQGVSIQEVSSSCEQLSDYWNMMHRWMIFSILLLGRLPFWKRCFVIGLLGVSGWVLNLVLIANLFLLFLLPFSTVILTTSFLLIRFAILSFTHRLLKPARIPFQFWASLISETLVPIHFTFAFFFGQIVWRGKRIRIGRDLTFGIQTEARP